MTKPFDIDVLLARIRAMLPRTQSRPVPAREVWRVCDLRIDAAAHTVHPRARPVELAPREFDVLLSLAQEAGHVVPFE